MKLKAICKKRVARRMDCGEEVKVWKTTILENGL